MTKNQLIAVFALPFLTAGAAQAAESGIVNFTGQIMADSCLVSVDTQNVDLGLVSKSSIATAGSSSQKVPFSIDLTDCDVNQPVMLKMVANAVGGETDIIQTSGGATGVGVGVWESGAGSRLPVNGYSVSKAADASRTLNFPFEAAYVSLGNVEAGPATATATFEVYYP